MKKKFTLITLSCLLLMLTPVAHAQAQPQPQAKIRGSIKGILMDSSAKQPMENATVSVTAESDTANQDFVIADKHGAFQFKSLPQGDYRLLITFEGFSHISRKFTVDATHKDIDLGTL